jgi:hypothetical protein
MSDTNYLDGYIYHMVHLDTFKGILKRRAILSKEQVLREGITHRSIAYEEVQSLRDRIAIWDSSENRFRPLHSYVPFYFSVLTPMLYVQYSNQIQDEIVILEVRRTVMQDRGVLFTDGNATNQQLAKYGSEKVFIKPATAANGLCTRVYSSKVPYGTNRSCSNIYADLIFLDRLDWNIINDRWFNDDEKKRIKHAEVLYPDLLPLGRVQRISVKTRDMMRTVNAYIEEYGLQGRIPSATWAPWLYF